MTLKTVAKRGLIEKGISGPVAFARKAVDYMLRRALPARKEPPPAPMIQPRVEHVPQQLREKVMPMTPPPDSVFVGDGDFLETAFRFLRVFKELGSLGPDEQVLEIGCGIGRMAVPLTQFLSATGSYQGFDIVREGIDWCDEHITKAYPNFSFQLVDLYNSVYNPNGRLQSNDFDFPYPDRSFDFVFLTSIFTHLLPDTAEHYLAEIQRVLKDEGRCLITVFLLNEDALGRVERRLSSQIPRKRYERHAVSDEKYPEAVVFYDEAPFMDLIASKGLRVSRPVLYGTWCGRPDGYEYQDVLVLKRNTWLSDSGGATLMPTRTRRARSESK